MSAETHWWSRLSRIDVLLSIGAFMAPIVGGAFEGIPWTMRIVLGLLAMYVLLELWQRHGHRLREIMPSIFGSPVVHSDRRGEAEMVSRFSARYTSGKVEFRHEDVEVEGKKWLVIKVSIHNETQKTMRNVQVFLQARTWSDTKFLTYKDSKAVNLGLPYGGKTLNPSLGFNICLIAQPVDAADQPILGDPAEPEAERDVLKCGTHFVTATLLAEDQPPEYKNFVILTNPRMGVPYAVEYDSRRWGSFERSPFGLAVQPIPRI